MFQFDLLWLPTIVRCIVVNVALIRYALIHFMFDVKAKPINEKLNLIRELILYEVERATKYICCAEGKIPVEVKHLSNSYLYFN